MQVTGAKLVPFTLQKQNAVSATISDQLRFASVFSVRLISVDQISPEPGQNVSSAEVSLVVQQDESALYVEEVGASNPDTALLAVWPADKRQHMFDMCLSLSEAVCFAMWHFPVRFKQWMLHTSDAASPAMLLVTCHIAIMQWLSGKMQRLVHMHLPSSTTVCSGTQLANDLLLLLCAAVKHAVSYPAA